MAWYDRGVCFECQRCGHCCGGSPGYVFLSDEDLEAIPAYLGVGKDEFIASYCRKVDMGSYSQLSLVEKEDYDCVFLTDKGCSIYPVRPLQCSTYPFWPYVFSDRALWEAEGEECPGIGKGPVHAADEIRGKVRATLLHKVKTIVDAEVE